MTASSQITNSDIQADETKENLPPAITLPLTGRYLIEASAGTGKTWTLTGVVLRLLVEAGQPCEKIIATTFTRSAAAEMRQRIRERLQDFNRLLRIITQNSFVQIINPASDISEKKEQFNAWLEQQVTLKGDAKLKESLQDPINQHLLLYIAEQVFLSSEQNGTVKNNPESNEENKSKTIKSNPLNFRIALQRTNTALNQLDRLFVSTLDSLCQKWLREFSSETGYSADVQISNDVETIVLAMIHDQLRAFWTQIFQAQPAIYQLMQVNGYLNQPKDYYKAVEKALNFYTAPIDNVTVESIDLVAGEQLISAIVDYRIDETFAQYFDEDYRLSIGFSKENLHTKFESFNEILTELQNKKIQGLFGLSKAAEDWLAAIKRLVEEGKGFKKEFKQQAETFSHLSIIQNLYHIYQFKEQLTTHFRQLNEFFTQFIARYVREQLPKLLEAQRLTTFSLQLARLNQALQGRQGEALARYIRHQYPNALIDESQDINTEQALLIQRIYLDTSIEKNSQKNERKSDSKVEENLFLLLVGDPKQAIYGFRGGDVHNYTTLKKQFSSQPIPLLQNRRSSKALIDSLNQWYGVAEMTDEQSNNLDKRLLPTHPYFLGEEIYYRKIDAVRETAELRRISSSNENEQIEQNLAAMFYINVPYHQPLELDNSNDNQSKGKNDDEVYMDYADVIAAQILALFDDTSDEKLKLKQRNLLLKDICVLARDNNALDEVEKKLQLQGIASIRSGNNSVFNDVMSADLQLLMAAFLNPFHLAKMKTLLMTKFFRLTLSQANELLEENPEDTTKIIIHNSQTTNTLASQISEILVKANVLWQKEGFLVAIQWFLTQSLTLPNQPTQTFWQRLASDNDGERLLIDLRQLIDILAENFQNQGVGEYQLYEWYCQQCQLCPKEDWSIQQRLPSEQGVQLMTIHRSKGLEFPIVFVVGLDKESSKSESVKNKLYLYSDLSTLESQATQQNQNPLLTRRLSAIPNDLKFDYKAIQQEGEAQESLRLMYVALTRARERLYIVTSEKGKALSSTPLQNFITDKKTFELNEQAQQAVTKININSLSKYFNKKIKLKHLQKTKKQNDVLPINYEKNQEAIKITKFIGWSNTSFTALSRFVSQDHQALTINEADYDGMDSLVSIVGIKEKMTIQTIPKKNNEINLSQTKIPINDLPLDNHGDSEDGLESAELSQSPPDWHSHTYFSDEHTTMYDDYVNFDTQTMPPDYFDNINEHLGNGNAAYDLEANFEPYEDYDYSQSADFYTDSNIELNSSQHLINTQSHYPNSNSIEMIQSESDLLRFNFEKGASAGTFLHKMLEDLANNQVDELTPTDMQSTNWTPPKRWAVMVDRALRRQQLSTAYYSTINSAAGELVKFADMDNTQYLDTLQPQYIQLTKWLNEIIHTPFAATGQRPIDIRQQNKAAEMGFNMRLNGKLSLALLNQLFADQGITLNLQPYHNLSSIWQYLRGEIDLVYQHEGKYYVVDYKSNYLGSSFADYQQDNLVQAMDEHRYWLQASIYQVALHRFLQMRLSDYDINSHLGAVEYAFIRGMAPSQTAQQTGKLVWQPDNDFILALDKLFGRNQV